MLVNIAKILSIAVVAADAVMADGSAYAYTCGNCKCNDVSKYFIDNFSGSSGCREIDTSIRAMGLTGDAYGKKTTCAIYTDANCGNEVQSIGVEYSQKWGCTAFNQDARSVQCWYDA